MSAAPARVKATPSPVLVALALLATFRATRLVTGDYLTDPPRRWLQRRLPEKLAYLIGCPWCASFWIGGGIAWVTYRWPHSRLVGTLWLALAGSATAGLAASFDPAEDYGTP